MVSAYTTNTVYIYHNRAIVIISKKQEFCIIKNIYKSKSSNPLSP
ncbi:MAG: hypothetical protein RIS29_459 [Bacteroidota bacterium]|jgi:hypothetical protein